MKQIHYPYVPNGNNYHYVDAKNPYMVLAKEFARQYSLDETMPTTSILVKGGVIIGVGANGSEYHKKHKCRRVIMGRKSGEGYELCEGCHPKNHSELKAVQDAQKKGTDTNGADLYLWGHWWCCKPCWDAMQKAGISGVFLLKDSEILFNKEHPNNIVGRQLEI